MKKFLSLTVLGLSLFTLAACGKSSSKTETKGSLDNVKYGFLEKENGVYYFKLNAKIGLVKR